MQFTVMAKKQLRNTDDSNKNCQTKKTAKKKTQISVDKQTWKEAIFDKEHMSLRSRVSTTISAN